MENVNKTLLRLKESGLLKVLDEKVYDPSGKNSEA